jgi:hypothetical protein
MTFGQFNEIIFLFGRSKKAGVQLCFASGFFHNTSKYNLAFLSTCKKDDLNSGQREKVYPAKFSCAVLSLVSCNFVVYYKEHFVNAQK